jgi:oligopeptide transport system ATP-binding protein
MGAVQDTQQPLLSVRGLCVGFQSTRGFLTAVHDLSFDLNEGETLGLIGESGSGKSTVALSIADLLPNRAVNVQGGEIVFENQDILKLPEAAVQELRGNSIGIIFQDPMTSLNPTMTIGHQISEPLRIHRRLGDRSADDAARDLLSRVGLPKSRLHDFPHQLSGGMRQRVMIAIALACRPKLLIADEPTTALDVTIQAQILELIKELSAEAGTAVILITHDLGLAAQMCDRVGVMYAGSLVEIGTVDQIFYQPRMPYTRSLLGATPRGEQGSLKELIAIPGTPPGAAAMTVGCRFAPRCGCVRPVCEQSYPPLSPRERDHEARCWGTEPDGWVA